MQKEMRRFGEWDPSMAKPASQGGLWATPSANLDRAFWGSETPTGTGPGDLDGPFVRAYERFVRKAKSKKTRGPTSGSPLVKSLDKVLYYMDVSKYPEVSQKQYKDFPNKLSQKNVRLLSALFDERKGISSTELGGKGALTGFMKQFAAREEYEKYRKRKGSEGMKHKKLKNKPKILTKMTGRMNRTWMLQYVNEFGPKNIRGRAEELSYDELRLETQKIADTLGPLLNDVGGDKGAFYGTQVLLHHTKKTKREPIELVASPPTSSTVVPEPQIQAIEGEEDAEDDPIFQTQGGVDYHAMPSLGAASPQMEPHG